MNICLIYPPDIHMVKTNVPLELDNLARAYPPLGLLYVASSLALSSFQHEVTVIDCVAENLDIQDVEEKIRSISPDLVGMQVLTFSLFDAYAVAKIVKKVSPDIKVAAGGPHVNLFPEETARLEEIDYVMLGEGENNFHKLIDALETNQDLSQIPGVVFQKSPDSLVFGPENPPIDDLDALPFPSRSLVEQSRYASPFGRGGSMTTIMSSRGCPSKCVFCNRPHMGKKFRQRSPENVVDEMEFCVREFNIEEFVFYDDTINIEPDRIRRMCELILSKRLACRWDARARVSKMTLELLKLMRKSGCERIHFGIESGNQSVLATIKKGIDLEHAGNVFRWCGRTGIETLAYFMMGFPFEGEKEVRDTINFALSLKCDYIHASATTPFPGTPLYQMGLEKGLYEKDYWREFAANPSVDFVPRVWDEIMSAKEIEHHLTSLYRRFYRNPLYILRQLRKVKSWKHFRNMAGAGLKILRI